MNYPHIFERVYLSVLAVHPARWQSAHAFLWPRILGKADMGTQQAPAPQAGEQRANMDAYSGKRRQKCRATVKFDANSGAYVIDDPRLYYEPVPGVAVVPIYGALAKNLSDFEESCGGGTDISSIETALRQVKAAEDIKVLILDIDSPGGQSLGIMETASLIREIHDMGIPVYAFSDAWTCSAAYWLACAATEIIGTPSSDWGSIGVFIAWIDPARRMEIEGDTLQFFKEGEHKGIGLPGRTLSESDKALMQAKVTECYRDFTAAVLAYRPGVASDTMQGQTFGAPEAMRRGLIDGLVSGWDELLELVADTHLPSS